MSRRPFGSGRRWSRSATALLLLAVLGGLPACGPDAAAPAASAAAATAAPAPQPPGGACRRFTSCVPENPCHTGWVTGCRRNEPICTDIGGWLSNGTSCGTDAVCYMGECEPCAAGQSCPITGMYGYPDPCRAGAISCDTGQPVCQDVGPAPDGTNCGSYPGSPNVCKDGQCTWCVDGEDCRPADAPCHVGVVTECQTTGGTCVDTGAVRPDGYMCEYYAGYCHEGECTACSEGVQCDPGLGPCWIGYTSCSTGEPVCSAYRAPEGYGCGDGLVCDANGACVPPCLNGDACTPWNECYTGTKYCWSPTQYTCYESQPVADGTPCSYGVCMAGSCTSCGAGSWCQAPDACHSAGAISCATGLCEPAGDPYADGTPCGVAGETCQQGACAGVPGGAVVVRAASGAAVDLTGTTWAECRADEPQPGESRRKGGSYVPGGAVFFEETFANPTCSGDPATRMEVPVTAVTAGDRSAGWAAYPPDGLWYPVTATAIAFAGVDPRSGEAFQMKDLLLVNEWQYPRRLYDGETERALAWDGYPTLLVTSAQTEVLPCTQGESCANAYGTCEAWAVDCSQGYPVCGPTGAWLPDATPCAGGSCQGGACVPGPGVGGVRQLVFWPDAGATAPFIPNDLWDVRAYWPDGGGGAYSGYQSWDGTFTVPGVPEGPYVLAFTRGIPYFVETDARFVDLGEDVLGRQDVGRAYASTPVTIFVYGLAPWQATDAVQLACGNTALGATPFVAGAVPVGATSASGIFEWQNQPLLETRDAAYLWQLTTSPIAGTALTYRSASRWAQAPPTTIVDGVPGQNLPATLGAVEAFAPFSVVWPTAAFAEHVGEINPAAAVQLSRLSVDVKPHATPAVGAWTLPFFVPNAAMVLTSRAPGAPPGDVTIQDASFGRFLPPHWVEYRDVRLSATVPVALPDGSQRTYNAAIVRLDELATMSPTAEPLVTPPLAPTVRVGADLVSAFEPRTGVGTGPLLAWSPPATGAPTSYTVLLLAVQPESNVFGVAGMAVTRGTSFRFPDGTLSPGTTYFAVISARSAERESLDAPLRMQFDADLAQAVTAGFTP